MRSLGQMIGPALAGEYAARAGGPLGMHNVNWPWLYTTLTGLGGNITVTAATSGFAVLSTPLKGTIVLHDAGRGRSRGLAVLVAGTISAGAAGNEIALSATIRGVEVTGLRNGIPGLYTQLATPQGVMGFHVERDLPAGDCEVEVVADAFTTDGTIHVGTLNTLALLALEL